MDETSQQSDQKVNFLVKNRDKNSKEKEFEPVGNNGFYLWLDGHPSCQQQNQAK